MELLFGEEFDRNDDEPPVVSSESGTQASNGAPGAV